MKLEKGEFLCRFIGRDPLGASIDDEGHVVAAGFTPEGAAEEYMYRHFMDWGHEYSDKWRETKVGVTGDDGKEVIYLVEPEPVMQHHAYPETKSD